ncbi:MAG: hypothetical protein ACOQNV_00275 [Mycoplasmoidaceae bacterium]
MKNKKNNKRYIALNCTIGALALLGSAGVITFGTLWCQARNNGGNTPTPEPVDDSTVEWTNDIKVEIEEGTENWYLDFDEYTSPIEPLAEHIVYESSDDATEAYYETISQDYKIFSNDVLCNMIINFFKMVDKESEGDGEARLFFPCPQIWSIDPYYSAEGQEGNPHYQWTSSNFEGTANLSCKTNKISWDDVHECIRVSSISSMSLAFSYKLTDPNDATNFETEHGSIAFYQSSENLPFKLGYGEEFAEWMGGYYLDNSWFTYIPDEFYGQEGQKGWAYDDEEWKLDFYFMGNAIDSSTMEVIPVDDTYLADYGYGTPGYYDKNAISELDVQLLWRTIPDLSLSLGQNSTNLGINYLKNCSVA